MVETAERVPAIHKAIIGVIADIGAVGKNKFNNQQNFKFRSIDDVYNVLNPALAKNKMFIVPEILEMTREVVGTTKNGAKMTLVTCRIKYTFFAEDGSFIETIISEEAIDTGDKAINKVMAIAYKYICFQVFCIPIEEIPDPDAESPEIKAAPEDKKQSAPVTGRKVQQQEESHTEDEKITQAMINTIKSEQERTGVSDKLIFSVKGVNAKKIEDMTVSEFKAVMKKFQVTGAVEKGGKDEQC